LEGKEVLDLGCGQGQAGAILLAKGANVTFQDFNLNVINEITPQVVKANLYLWGTTVVGKDRYISGDWDDLSQDVSGRYHIIVTADTVYNIEYYPKLYKYIRASLKEDGVCINACQAYYYGWGGGDQEFINFVNKYNEFDVTKEEEFDDGRSIKRSILYIKWKPGKYSESTDIPEPEQNEEDDFLQF